MSYFEEISKYSTYSERDDDFHFNYNANSGGGQAFLGGRFLDDKEALTSPEMLNGKTAIFKIVYYVNGVMQDVLLDDVKAQYEIKPRAAESTSMKLSIGNNRESPSKVISSFMMLPATCGVKMPVNPDNSILSTNNYWLQSMWLRCEEIKQDVVKLIPRDFVFCGGVSKAGNNDNGRCFALDANQRIVDIINLSYEDELFSAEIITFLKVFSDIYVGIEPYNYEKCAEAVRNLMSQMAKEYPETYAGIEDPLPKLREVYEKEKRQNIPIKDVATMQRVQGGYNIILYGVPGSGKSWTIENEYCSDDSKMERLVFHPDYMYSDFIGQILPVVKEDKVRYEFTPGPFTKLLTKAYQDPNNMYYLIIEEINRGNAPAIFGEVFQLLDRIDEKGKEYPVGTSEYAITNNNIAEVVYGSPEHKVRIPSNLSIIGTMNTSDQNVFTLDTAFQRRWIMRMIPNTFGKDHKFADKQILDTTVTWKTFCKVMNEEILRRNNVTSSEDKRLGAYFISATDLDWQDESTLTKGSKEWIDIHHKNSHFAEKVLKYLWDDAFKFSHAETFNTKQYGSLESVIDGFMSAKENLRYKVFNNNLRGALIDDGGSSASDNDSGEDNTSDFGDEDKA